LSYTPVSELIGMFPELAAGRLNVTSEADPRYNCIAWAAGTNQCWWWPFPIDLPGPRVQPLLSGAVTHAVIACYADYAGDVGDLAAPEIVTAPRQTFEMPQVTASPER